MPVTLIQPAEGLEAGETYSGPNESWLVSNGYAERPDVEAASEPEAASAPVLDRREQLLAEVAAGLRDENDPSVVLDELRARHQASRDYDGSPVFGRLR